MGLFVSACLTSRDTDSLLCRLTFWGCLHKKQFWKVEILFPSRAKAGLLAPLKDRNGGSFRSEGHGCLLPVIGGSSSLSSVFRSDNAIHCVYKYHSTLRITLWELGLGEPVEDIANSLLLLLLWVRKSCLWPRTLVISDSIPETGRLTR